MIHSFLLIGQSNMAGRGIFSEVEPIDDIRLRVLRNGRWLKMFQPVNPDRSVSGVNLAESFALAYADTHPGVEVGLIPCADGGTSLDQWCVGSLLYDNAVNNARLAQRTSTIAGVLWHQGESDCYDGRHVFYEEKFLKIMNNLKKDLDLYDVPFLLGGLGDFLAECQDGKFVKYTEVNKTLEKIADENPMTGFVPATGLESNPDNLHFCSKALREFGLRYYEKFAQLEDKSKVFEEKSHPDAAVRSGIELL